MYGYIYKIENTVNNKVYIGQTKRNPKVRFQEYKRGCHNSYLDREFKKYGIDNFTFVIIDTANSYEDLNEKEMYWISFYKSTDNSKGYNLCEGGNGPIGAKWSQSACNQASSDRKGSRWFHNEKGERHLVRSDKIDLYSDWIPGYGPGRKRTPHSEETKEKIKESNKGKHQKTVESLNKQINSYKKNKFHWYTNGIENKQISEYDVVPEGFYRGRIITDEQRKKCGEKNIGKEPWNKGLTKETDFRVKQYSDSIKKTLNKIKAEKTS